MTSFPTCQGCKFRKGACAHKNALRERIKGLRVTTIKWNCAAKIAEFESGDSVWAFTLGDTSYPDSERDNFPATVVRMVGSNVLVYIPAGALGRDIEEKFVPMRKGFCKIPLNRITARDAPREQICEVCELPASCGHQEGFSCMMSSK